MVIIIIIISIYLSIYLCHSVLTIPCEFFTSALADHPSPETAWQQVSSSLLDSSHYSSRFLKCCGLRFSNLPVPLPCFWILFRERLWYLLSPSPLFSITFLVLWQCLSISLSSRFLWFSIPVLPGRQSVLFSHYYYYYYYYYSKYLTMALAGSLLRDFER